jgi:hypothetical protein
MSSLLLLNRVYKLEIQSVLLVFLTSFVNYCPSIFVSGKLPPALPFVNKYTILYTRIQYVRGWEHGVIGGEGASDR